MDRLYTIRVERSTGLVEVQIIGFWTEATVKEFGGRLREAFDEVEGAGKVPVLLSDSTHAAVQSADVVAAMTQLGHELSPLPRKTALLTTGQLLQFQAKRVVAAETALASFSSRDAAVEWLLAEDSPAAEL